MYINYDSKQIFKWLLSIILILTLLNSFGIFLKFNFDNLYVNSLVRIIDFDTEANIPTFFSAVMLLISSGLLLYISNRKKTTNSSYTLWLILAIIFLFLSIDESAVLHERLIVVTRNMFNLKGLLFFGWVIPYGIILIILSFIYIPFLIKLDVKTRNIFVFSALIFVFGALIIELFEGKNYEFNGADIIHSIYYTFEEFFEMLGVSIFIYGLLDYISRNVNK